MIETKKFNKKGGSNMLRVIFVLMLSVTMLYAGAGQQSHLSLPVGERACSMAGAFTALSDDGTALFWNPAGATQLEGKTMTIGHTDYVADIKMANAAYTTKIGSLVVGAGFKNLYVEDWRRDINGNVLGTFVNNITQAGVMVSKDLGSGLSVGATFKGLHQQLDTSRVSGAAVDFGAIKSLGGVNLGVVVQNVGVSGTEGMLPTDLRIGVGFTGLKSGTISSDIEIPVDGKKSIMVGGEYNVYKSVFVRGGYRIQEGGSELGILDGLNAGLGFAVGTYTVNYGIAPFGDFAATHRISLNTTFK